MSHKKRALVVVEGKTTEPRFIGERKNSKGLLSFMREVGNYEIFSFKSSIYELYDDFKLELYDDLVTYLVQNKGLRLPAGETARTAFSAIYLIFDFDPQYHKYSDETITEMLQTFNNETELGKLYINYPMVEACWHLKSLPDPDFIDRKIAPIIPLAARVTKSSSIPKVASLILAKKTCNISLRIITIRQKP